MNKYVLDASALLALLNNETGANIVEELLPESVISSINFSEVVARLSLLGIPNDEIHNALDILGLEIILFDSDLAYLTGNLAAPTKPFGLSIGDRACLALAMKTGRTAVTADTIWGKIPVKVDVKLIR
ncbi:type II toxin-antitoxin system VapC family toxin [Leptolinea tardivitalis]|uniref:PIN domain-containing protein n=1 Tax=Leptolinea tardivitalis TaxID=229920 RepID=A0A0P6XVI4_9CHLR|nr:type II toxin-antitoxin system VapC family toxin [Leptolinea tardivitalis]KPL73374.1 hypothetical protein ADM99_03960 [Leptolinea tardivitalis]GAP21515.1 uncharacterized protein conserved in bacteria [Leptolinea tardivitalis]